MKVKELIALLESAKDKEMEVVCGLAHGGVVRIKRVTVETGRVIADQVWLDECVERITDHVAVAEGDRRILR